MKKAIFSIVVIVIIVIALSAMDRKPSGWRPDGGSSNASSTPTAQPVIVTETTKVSGKTSQFQNAELGFSVNYPTAWEPNGTDTGVAFIMPIDQSQVSTVAKLQADINIQSGKCSFPPVTTIKDRGTLLVNGDTLNMISMSNTVQGRAYFNRMYSLQKGSVCYIFSFASISLSPESKNLTGSNLTQAKNNNLAIINTADANFTEMVKSFEFVTGPAGVDETKAAPVKR